MKTYLHKKSMLLTMLTASFLAIMTGCEYEVVEPDRTPITEEVKFSEKIIPIFNASCNNSGCHATGSFLPDLSPANAYASLISENQINTENPAASALYISVTTGSMKSFSTAEQAKLILAWIEQGAKNN